MVSVDINPLCISWPMWLFRTQFSMLQVYVYLNITLLAIKVIQCMAWKLSLLFKIHLHSHSKLFEDNNNEVIFLTSSRIKWHFLHPMEVLWKQVLENFLAKSYITDLLQHLTTEIQNSMLDLLCLSVWKMLKQINTGMISPIIHIAQ